MWVFHPDVGFFSAVIDNLKPGNILVRFRDPNHARAFAKFAGAFGKKPKVRETPLADYRWKFSIPRNAFECVMMGLAEEVDYSNFKGECATRPLMKTTLHDLHDVWSTMNQHQNRLTRGEP